MIPFNSERNTFLGVIRVPLQQLVQAWFYTRLWRSHDCNVTHLSLLSHLWKNTFLNITFWLVNFVGVDCVDWTNLVLRTNELMHLEYLMPSQLADEPKRILLHPIAQPKSNILYYNNYNKKTSRPAKVTNCNLINIQYSPKCNDKWTQKNMESTTSSSPRMLYIIAAGAFIEGSPSGIPRMARKCCSYCEV